MKLSQESPLKRDSIALLLSRQSATEAFFSKVWWVRKKASAANSSAPEILLFLRKRCSQTDGGPSFSVMDNPLCSGAEKHPRDKRGGCGCFSEEDKIGIVAKAATYTGIELC